MFDLIPDYSKEVHGTKDLAVISSATSDFIKSLAKLVFKDKSPFSMEQAEPQDSDTPTCQEEVKELNFVKEVTGAAKNYENAAKEVMEHI